LNFLLIPERNQSSNFRCLSNYSLRYMLIFFKRTFAACLTVRLLYCLSSHRIPSVGWVVADLFYCFNFPPASRHSGPVRFGSAKVSKVLVLQRKKYFFFFLHPRFPFRLCGLQM